MINTSELKSRLTSDLISLLGCLNDIFFYKFTESLAKQDITIMVNSGHGLYTGSSESKAIMSIEMPL